MTNFQTLLFSLAGSSFDTFQCWQISCAVVRFSRGGEQQPTWRSVMLPRVPHRRPFVWSPASCTAMGDPTLALLVLLLSPPYDKAKHFLVSLRPSQGLIRVYIVKLFSAY